MFVVLGIAGLFLPVLQGVLFLLVGLILLSTESSRARWLRQAFRRRYPGIGKRMDDARDWLARARQRFRKR